MPVGREVLFIRAADDNVVFGLHGELNVMMSWLNSKEMKILK